MSEPVRVRVEKAIKEKVFPGCVIGIVHADGKREVMPFGHFTYEGAPTPVREDSIYDLASITKSIPTASLALAFADGGMFSLDALVRTYVPKLQNDHGAIIEDLLTYAVSGPRLSTLKEKKPDDMLTHIFEHGFEGPRGARKYTNLPALILGLVLERAAGDTLGNLARTYFFDPVGMKDTTFFPFRDLAERKDDIAPTEIDEWRGEVRGIAHDESAYVFAKEERAVGHAGLFSSAPDILNFLEALLRGKFPAIVAGAQKGLGWQLNQEWFMGAHCGPRTFGKTGFTGTSVVCDIEKGIGFVILSNRTYPKRPADAAEITSAINPFRCDIADILLR